MKNLISIIALVLFCGLTVFVQEVQPQVKSSPGVPTKEPEFVGEAYLLKADGTFVQLDKEIGDFTSGISWSNNSWNALSLKINGGSA